MRIVPSERALVLKLSNPARVTQVLPSAKEFVFSGERLLAVPHRLEETRILNSMGFKVPSPVRYYYDWSGPNTPFDHQTVTTEFLTLNPHAYCLNDMGTGKTLSVLWAVDYLMRTKQVRKVLVAAPLSTLERVWGDALFFNFPHLTYQVVHSPNRTRRERLLAQDVDIYITNHDGVKVLRDMLAERKDIDLVVIDELAVFRNAGTDMFKSMRDVVDERVWLWGLTGAPIPKAPTDAWAQCRLITPDTVPRYFGKFRDLTMKQVGPFKWESRPEALTVVANAMQPSIRYKRDDCIDLPPTTYSTRHVEMSKEQKALYKEMSSKLKTEWNSGTITAVNAAVKAVKLIQIACGVAYGTDGNNVVIPARERMSVVQEIVEEAEGKVIVFVALTGGLQRMAEDVASYTSVAVVDGSVNINKRNEIFREFQDCAEPRVLVAHPECMAHGLTLTAASVIVWYIPTQDGEIYEQACARIPRPGQKRHTHIIHLEGSEIERRAYKRLQEKAMTQGALLSMIQDI